MKNLRFYLSALFLVFLGIGCTIGQEDAWFYLRAKDSAFMPSFDKQGELLVYKGADPKLKNVLDAYEIRQFKKTLRKAKKKYLNRTFFVRADKESLLRDLLLRTTHLFESGEIIPAEDKKIYEPNDYGLTSTIGENLGLQVNMDYLDFLGLPKAWYYTTGNKDFVIGISDGIVDTTDADFKDKTRIIRPSNLAKGHGYSIGANAAAQGDNAHGIPGICYDCGIYSTTYGDFRNLAMLEELSDMGVKAINCSWSATFQRETAQEAVDRMFEKGTIIVATSGNKSWSDTKGRRITFPASYDKVICVSSGMYKHETVSDNIVIGPKGNYAATNIRGYVGRALGFKNNDTLVEPHVYPISTANLNPNVDILAPTAGLVSYGKKILNDSIYYSRFETTSGAAPLVTGTIGLMFSLNPCLPVDEVESILKMTSMNVDHLEGNKPYKGMYGAGILQTGDAVEMVYNLYSPNEKVYVRDQQFDRWDFKLTALSEEVIIQDQKFTGTSTLDLKARKRILLKPGTKLSAEGGGKMMLKIDTSLKKQCDLVLRDPSIAEN